MEYYILVLVGAIISLLFSLNDALVVKGFTWKCFTTLNIFPTILNMIVGATIIYLKEDPLITKFITITGFTAVMLGVSGQYVFKKIIKMFDRKTDTFIGINE